MEIWCVPSQEHSLYPLTIMCKRQPIETTPHESSLGGCIIAASVWFSCSCNTKSLPPTISYSYNLGKGPRGSCFFWVSWAFLMPPEGNISIQKQRYNTYCQCSMSICLLSRRLFFLYRTCPLLHAFLWWACLEDSDIRPSQEVQTQLWVSPVATLVQWYFPKT